MRRSHIAVVMLAESPKGIWDHTGIDGVDRSKGNEHSKMFPGSVNSINTEGDIIQDCCKVFAAIDKMRKYVLRVSVTTNAL
jgi:hypothetical protein